MIYTRTRIKMCGMTRADDLAYATTLGVDAVGFIFYEKSSRYITLAKAKALLNDLPAFVDAVAVVVNPTVSLVRQIIDELPIQYLQFHGEETAAFCEQFDYPYVKAIAAASKELILLAAQEHQQAKAILLDTPSLHSKGGIGVPFDWNIIPKKYAKPVILAGGLDATNVSTAIASCMPYAVDICSGIEASHGIKDHNKMNEFVNSVRGKK